MLTDRSDAQLPAVRSLRLDQAEGANSPAGVDAERLRPRSRARRQPREPRPEEIALIRWLVDGPKPVLSGPIGRCVKRGWCDPLILEGPNGSRKDARVLYRLTEEGRRLVAEHGPASRRPSGPVRPAETFGRDDPV